MSSCPFSGTLVAEPPLAFPMPRGRQMHPPEEMARLRALPGLARVTLWDGKEAWLVTRYEDFRAVLKDSRFSADTRLPNFPNPSAGMQVARGHYRSFVSMDNPEHNAHRRLLTAEFSRNRIDALRPQIQAIIDELLTKMLAGEAPADFFTQVALPLPSRVICLMLGVPYDMHHFFEERAEIMVSTESTVEEAVTASRELIDEYLGDLLDEKAKAPTDDILSRLVDGPMAEGFLNRGEVLNIARLLLVAGHDTTANTSAMSLVTLLLHPEQKAELTARPELMTAAVEELLRYLDPTHGGRRRVALEDVEIGGQLIRAGEGVVAHNPSADRDESVYPDADRFDIHRKGKPHVAFGDGIHQCLGQNLARAEIEMLLNTLFERAPQVSLAVPAGDLEFSENRVVYGIKSLPISW